MGTGILLAASSYTRAITNLKSVLLTLGSAIGAFMVESSLRWHSVRWISRVNTRQCIPL